MRALVLAAVAVGRLAHADTTGELDAIRRAVPACDAARAHCFALQFHVAGDDAARVATAEWIATQAAAANRHFAPLDVGFQLAGVDALPASAAHIATRGERDALAKGRLTGKVVHVFIVGQLDDVDVAGAIAYGVTWHTPHDDRKYLIVSAQALERTLAHELGHFFGLPHSDYAISIMNKTARDEPPMDQRTFADEEITAMRSALRRIVRDKILTEQKL